MPELAMMRGSSDRQGADGIPWKQVNMMTEASPTNPKGVTLLSRPPMTLYATRGIGPIHALVQRDALFDGNLFTISGNTLYRGSFVVGNIDGDGPVSWASSRSEIVFARGERAWSYNGTNLAPIAFPDGARVRAVAQTAERFYFIRAGSDRFYWSALGDARSIDPLNYATAESEPDQLFDIKIIGDNLYLLGSGSGEVWVATGDVNLPFSRIVQRNVGRGVQGTNCAEVADNTLYMIGSEGVVFRMEQVPIRVSDHSLEEKIRKSRGGRMFQWFYEGHLVICVQIDQGTWGFDITSQQWFELQTHGRPNWAAQCTTQVGSEPLFGDGTNGSVWRFGEPNGLNVDADAAGFPRIFSAGAPSATSLPIFNVLVDGNSGATEDEIGLAADPMMEMRYSRDGGRTWSSWRSTRWGRKGHYRRQARFGSCGHFEAPGVLMEFRMSSHAPLRVDAVRVNESLAGRGRS